MTELIKEDVKVLVYHINEIAKHRKLNSSLSINPEFINHKEDELIELRLNYLLKEENKDPEIIVSSSITISYNQYLDDKDEIIFYLNKYFYEDILICTTFEQNNNNNKNNKYQWN